MEVIVPIIVSKLVYFTYLGDDLQPTCIGVRTSIDPKYQQDIPVPFLPAPKCSEKTPVVRPEVFRKNPGVQVHGTW